MPPSPLPLLPPVFILSAGLVLGGIQQPRGQNFAIFLPPPLRGQFLYPERGKNSHF